MVGLKRVATKAPMYGACLTLSLPPHTVRRPRRVPESRFKGATPTKAASCLGVSSPPPSSGNSAISVLAKTGPTPGTPRESASFSRQVGLSRIAPSRSPSVRASSFSSHFMCASMRFPTGLLAAAPRRFFSAVSISTVCLRLARIAANSRASSSGKAWADGLGEASEHLGVDPIGLGELAGGPSEVARLAGVDRRHGDRRCGQGGGHGSLEASGGLRDHQLRARPLEPSDERVDAGRVVGKAEVLA